MPNTRYLDASEVDLAEKISRGLESPEGYRVLTKSEYFSRPDGMCVHPQGWPCFKACIREEGPKVEESAPKKTRITQLEAIYRSLK